MTCGYPTSPTRTQTWTLDPLGNWDQTVLDSTTESRTHNDVNELTQRTIGQDPSISLTYDDAGNLIQDGDSDGDHKYTWDYRNRLIEVEEKQSGNWNTVAEYKYDGKTRRVLKVVTNKGDLNGTTRFVWGGQSDWQCLEERDGSGNLVARYTCAPGYIDAVARQERDLNADDDFGDDDEVVWYHANTLYSVYALTDGSDNVVERYRYDAYGACTVLEADFSADADGLSDVENPYAFTGRRLDLESELMQYRQRYYSTELGRFVSRDPIGYVRYFDLYVYVAGWPTGATDPMGLDEEPWGTPDFLWHYWFGGGEAVDLHDVGLFDLYRSRVEGQLQEQVKAKIEGQGAGECEGEGQHTVQMAGTFTATGYAGPSRSDRRRRRRRYRSGLGGVSDPLYALANGAVRTSYKCSVTTTCKCCVEGEPPVAVKREYRCSVSYELLDRFTNPLDIGGKYQPGHDLPFAEPYDIDAKWSESLRWTTGTGQCP